ncbi:MAG: type II toxin-antitoxin system HicB family antitoxin [Candidatus Sungiibacteriota bacterium]
MNQREFTAIYQKRGKRYIAWVEEIPGVNTQGKTKKEAQENLREALLLILEANRRLSQRQNGHVPVFRESFRVRVPARV